MSEMFVSDQWSPEVAEADYFFERPPLLSEYLPEHPEKVLEDVFSSFLKYEALKEQLAGWMELVGVLEQPIVEENAPLSFQYRFYKALPELMQALYDFYDSDGKATDACFSRKAIKQFCRHFPRAFTHRELWCFLNAVVVNSTEDHIQYAPDKVLDWYEQVSCLVEAAYLLSHESAQMRA